MKTTNAKTKMFHLVSREGGDVLLEAKCNEEFMALAIKRMKEESESMEYPPSDLEILEDILIREKVDYDLLSPIRMEW